MLSVRRPLAHGTNYALSSVEQSPVKIKLVFRSSTPITSSMVYLSKWKQESREWQRSKCFKMPLEKIQSSKNIVGDTKTMWLLVWHRPIFSMGENAFGSNNEDSNEWFHNNVVPNGSRICVASCLSTIFNYLNFFRTLEHEKGN